jgi:hypothetical protein
MSYRKEEIEKAEPNGMSKTLISFKRQQTLAKRKNS